ncbi:MULTISPECIES: hypothetical protein [Alphaproteobacteria]|uniref:Uncharacterized protein n=2 Tax=Alphaproteobacteria TaxID=28211 RepID=A0A512HFZ2_9HYPH|nr:MULTISPECIES: hypothetical protein [Alphaproteobacteria]GEO84368.1 hypothetical protein RNA01_13000 [Ciceribacter naphthalenivorans]GLR24905.1 hypothetical protein GCM10007920_46990 [Ciceribacter naphthalenivorans]GLT07761.1 hypothetical protein GCM10007926_46990 [Sphingomonas psychrolutea]
MRRLFLILLGLLAAPALALAGEPTFYAKAAKSLSECEKAFSDTTPDFKRRREFIVRRTTDGRERVIQCMPDGVVELFCDPKSGRSVVAVLEGETLPACARLTIGLKVRKEKTLISQ